MNKQRFIRALVALIVVSIVAGPLAAQTLSGIVIDERTGEPIRGAEIVLVGTPKATTSDLSGNFAIPLEAGAWEVKISHPTFTPQTLSVTIAEGEDNNLGVVMSPRPAEQHADATPLDAASDGGAGDASTSSEAPVMAEPIAEKAFAQSVTVTASSIDATEQALLTERKQASGIQDAIGRLEISKGAASSSASAMQRVTGVQVVDDKYVYVRGLGERYSNTTVNGSIIPTTEPEKRVVPLDLFAANLLNKVSVTKSYSADKPGEFAAGFVELETLDFPARQTLSLTLGSTYYSGVSGRSVPMFADGLDFFGGGGLAMPSVIPDRRVVRRGLFDSDGFSAEELEVIGEGIQQGWAPSSESAGALPNFSLTWGNTMGRVGLIVSASHSAAYDFTEERQIYYAVGEGGSVDQSHDYDMATGEQEVRQGVVANLSYRLTPNNNVKLQTLLTRTGTAEGRRFEGFNDDAFNVLRDERLRYQQESIFSAKLSGEHYLPGVGFGSGSLIEWFTSSSEGTNDENLRQTQYDQIAPGVFRLADEPQSGLLLYNELVDSVGESRLDYSVFYSTPSVTGTVKAGGAITSRDRDFDSRRFRFVPNPRARVDFTLSADELFIPENIGPNAAFEIREETRSTDSYDATHDVTAAYVMGDAAFGRWRLVAGARLEESSQEVLTFNLFDRDAAPIESVIDEQDILPAFNVTYALSSSANLRAGYSQTLNRPEFRELAPFEFSDVRGGRATAGNPNLKRASIESVDLRWEWFPRADEVIAASVFLKSIDDPIERVIRPTQQLSTTFANADSAENFGLELEFRRSLAFLSEGWREWSLITNYTWVDSKVDIADADQGELTSVERPLVGQAENVFNLTTEWAPARYGSIVRLLYNYTGEKITDVGARGLPDIYQDAVNTVDLVWLQDLGRWAPGLRLKATAENLTDEERLLTIGGKLHNAYTPGREFGLSLSFNVF